MYTTYHFKSATEINADILDVIKAAFKSKPIKLTVEEDNDETTFLLSNANKSTLLQSIEEDKNGTSIKVNIAE